MDIQVLVQHTPEVQKDASYSREYEQCSEPRSCHDHTPMCRIAVELQTCGWWEVCDE